MKMNILMDLVIGDETNSGTPYPTQFQNMSNEFEVALWVAQHPRILNLAKEIQNAKSTSINERSQVLSSASSYPTSSTTSLEIDQVLIFIVQ
jgi:hypothetical protein